MKLKKWIILSYIIVMLIPILTAGFLYKWIEDYNKRIEITDYIETINKFDKYEEKLNNPEIYLQEKGNLKILDNDEKNKIQIKLYSKHGFIFYSSLNYDYKYYQNSELLYKNLYEIKHGHRADSIKKPVFKDNEIVGFYEISIVRDRWLKGVNFRTSFATALFIIIALAIFLYAVWLIDRKLNKPVKKLIYAMNMFAKGQNVDIKYNKKDELGELITHFTSMKEDIEEKKGQLLKQQKIKEYMIAAISHDLKTPLTAIRAYAEACNTQSNMPEETIKNYTSIILNKCDYMKNMLDDLLTYTVLTSDYKMDFKEVEGQEFFEMLFSGYDEICEKKELNLHVDVNINGMYKVDVNQMIRVVDNLVNNGIRYTPQNKNIYLGAFSDDFSLPSWIDGEFTNIIDDFRKDGAVLIVKNDGQAINQDEYKKIFTPFYQIDASRNKTKDKGTGIGLSTVKLIVEKHGGKIKVLSKDGYGTIMICYLRRSYDGEGF